MQQKLLIGRKSLYSTIVITLLAIWFIIPNFWNCNQYSWWLPQRAINLGLDLRGGVYLLLELDTDTYLTEQLTTITENLRKELRSNKIGYKSLAVQKNSILLELRDTTNYDQLKNILSDIDKDLALNRASNKLTIYFSNKKYMEIQDNIVANSIEVLRSRVDSTGVSEPSIRRQGQSNIALEVPGIDDPKLLKSLITRIAKLTFNIVVDDDIDQNKSSDVITINGYHNPEHKAVVHKQPVIRGDLLNHASVSFNQYSQPCVAFSFNSQGKKLLAKATTENKGKKLAIILDGKLLSAPVVSEPILGGEGIISGNFTIDSASELSLLLKSGALPTTINIIEERAIGPTLGQDLIHSSKIAGYVGFSLVGVLMLIVYGTLGILAMIALVVYIIYVIAILSALEVTLTLHGIAGVILTMGMAVDANILIYERVREEIKQGCSMIHAIRNGFKLSAAAIIDSNITTLLISLVLYIFGTGAFRGFGVVLAIGVICSMYSSIIITRILIDIWIRLKLPIKIR